jgi:hypothetical protein
MTGSRNQRHRVTELRRQWGATRQTTCLLNHRAKMPAAGKIELLPERRANAKQIVDTKFAAQLATDQERGRVVSLMVSGVACS